MPSKTGDILSNSLKIEHSKEVLDNDFIEAIQSSEFLSIVLDRVIIDRELFVKNKTISLLSIADSKIASSIIFINCIFLGPVSFTKLKTSGAITFTSCTFNADIKFYSCENIQAINFLKNESNASLFLDGVSVDYLELNLCSFSKVLVISTGISGNISNIQIIKSKIQLEIEFSNYEIGNQINIENVVSQSFIWSHINFTPNSALQIRDSHLHEIKVERNIFRAGAKMGINGGSSANIDIIGNQHTETLAVFEGHRVNERLTLLDIDVGRSVFDISGAWPESVLLSSVFVDFITNSSAPSPLILPTHSYKQKIGTFKILKNMFYKEHQYSLEDECFFRLKNEECKNLILEAKGFLKVSRCLTYFSCRYIMGWGVSMRNVVISIAVTLTTFMFIFYSISLYTGQSCGLEYLNMEMHGLPAAFLLSLLTFSGHQADAKIGMAIPGLFYALEFVIGMFMMVLVTGMFIRKLVR